MADALPDAPWATGGGTNALPDAPWATDEGLLKRVTVGSEGPLTETYNQAKQGLGSAEAAFNPFSQEQQAITDEQIKHPFSLTPKLESAKLLAKGIGGIGQAASSWFTGPALSIGGHILEMINSGMRSGAVKLYGEDKVQKAEEAAGRPVGGENYEQAKEDAGLMLSALAPGRRASVPIPQPPAAGPLGVTLSEGQSTGALPAIQREQSALANRLGPAAADRAKQFETQQAGQVQEAQEGVRKSFDPFGQTVASTPQEAGQLVSQGVQQAAAQRKTGVDSAYQYARSLPGEVHADAFKDIGARIRDDLSNRQEPIIIDDSLTPFASKAIQDIDNRVGQLQIQNRASNTGQPAQNSIMGVTLNGVDQMRKRLSALRSQAFGTGNATDGRAVKSVIDAFDDHIDHAINNGLFTGDKRAIDAWNDARAAHADYSKTFKASKGDQIGRVVEKIIGKNNNPAAIPNDVADHLYGAQGVNPNSLNVGVANRVKSILGDQSPEWSGVKQGLFSRLVEPSPGMTDFGSQKIKERINKFLNGDGKELAEAVYSPQDRQLIQQYADLHEKLVVPPRGGNPPNTSTFIAPILRKIGSQLGLVIGGIAGGAAGHALGIPFAGEAIGAGTAMAAGAISHAREARQISKQMPLVATRMKQYQAALAKANRATSMSPIQKALGSNELVTATERLAQALGRIGVKMNTLQGPIPAGAQQEQP